MANGYKELDKLDWKILTEMQKNARISFSDLGKAIGLTAPAVTERIHKLEEAGIINGYHANVNIEKLGYPIRAIIHMKLVSGKFEDIMRHLNNIPQIYECNHITGNDCFMMKIAIRQTAELEIILNGLKDFGGTSTSIVLSTPIERKVFTG